MSKQLQIRKSEKIDLPGYGDQVEKKQAAGPAKIRRPGYALDTEYHKKLEKESEFNFGAAYEQESSCCCCISIPCASTILLILEIFYFLGHIITIVGILTLSNASGFGDFEEAKLELQKSSTELIDSVGSHSNKYKSIA